MLLLMFYPALPGVRQYPAVEVVKRRALLVRDMPSQGQRSVNIAMNSKKNNMNSHSRSNTSTAAVDHLEKAGVAHSQRVHDGDVAVKARAAVLEDDDRDARRRAAVHLGRRVCPKK